MTARAFGGSAIRPRIPRKCYGESTVERSHGLPVLRHRAWTFRDGLLDRWAGSTPSSACLRPHFPRVDDTAAVLGDDPWAAASFWSRLKFAAGL